MRVLIKIFGEGKDLSSIQMSCRGIVIFLITLILIRISGRRSFGLKTPLDNIIVITLGAILSRAVVGASDFMPVVITSLVIVSLHRLFSWLTFRYKRFAEIIEGTKIILYENNHFIDENMKKALTDKEDIMQGVRKSALTENMQKIDKVYMERNGEISPVKKES